MSRPGSPRGLMGALGTDAASQGKLQTSLPLAIFEAEEGCMALTDYDQTRTPIKPEDCVGAGVGVATLRFAEIVENVLCPICLDILHNTVTAKQVRCRALVCVCVPVCVCVCACVCGLVCMCGCRVRERKERRKARGETRDR